MEEHARQELLEEYFSSSGVGAPEMEGYVWLKADNKKSWKRLPFVLRTSGLYYAPKGKKSSKSGYLQKIKQIQSRENLKLRSCVCLCLRKGKELKIFNEAKIRAEKEMDLIRFIRS